MRIKAGKGFISLLGDNQETASHITQSLKQGAAAHTSTLAVHELHRLSRNCKIPSRSYLMCDALRVLEFMAQRGTMAGEGVTQD